METSAAAAADVHGVTRQRVPPKVVPTGLGENVAWATEKLPLSIAEK